ncbi:MAG: two-component system sensor histidine kinase ZraS [Desulfovibrio sp.]|nr:two-component system sensor histidine kinase ZraS [Desulfovibrio sp.]
MPAVNDVKRKTPLANFPKLSSSPLFFVLACAVLGCLLLSFATLAVIRQTEDSMAELLGEKGASLLKVCESILRSGLRHEIGIRLQVLLEEMAVNSDIIFAAVTMPDGTILAHSVPDRLGEQLEIAGQEVDLRQIFELKADLQAKWRFMELEGHTVFAVYRVFTPGLDHLPKDLPLPIIFLGLDPSPFEITRSQNRIYISLLTGISLLMLLSSLCALFFAERARISRQKQKQAEVKVKSLEEEVRRKEKLAAIGSLAAGVAHEIRNPLSSIKGYATFFAERFPLLSEERQGALIMVEEVERLNRVISDLLDLAKPSAIKPGLVDCGALLQEVACLLKQDALRQGVFLRVKLGAGRLEVLGDRERLHQALLNLSLNALQAMPNGGGLALGCFAKAGLVYLLVKDSGCGLSPTTLSHIFDPYFTTKKTGTGLGLALVHKIVLAHKGRLKVRSKEASPRQAGWTMFTLILSQAREEDFHASSSPAG